MKKKKPQAAESHQITTINCHLEQINYQELQDDDVMKTTHANDVNTKHDDSRLKHETDNQPEVKDDNSDVSHRFAIYDIYN